MIKQVQSLVQENIEKHNYKCVYLHACPFPRLLLTAVAYHWGWAMAEQECCLTRVRGSPQSG